MIATCPSLDTRGGRRLGHRRWDERGSVEVEFALGTVVLLIFLMFVVGMFRVVDAEADVQTAASAAARAASRQGTPGAASLVAQDTAMANLTEGTTTCGAIDVDTATGRLEPGGSITVTVRCTVDHTDLVLVSIPGRRDFTSTATAAVDRLRGNSGEFEDAGGVLGSSSGVEDG
jgi:Flp pilus assembly protein TadG